MSRTSQLKSQIIEKPLTNPWSHDLQTLETPGPRWNSKSVHSNAFYFKIDDHGDDQLRGKDDPESIIEKSVGQNQGLDLRKKRSQYFDQAFDIRKTKNDFRARAAYDYMVLAQVAININIERENSFLVDFCFKLSEIYNRPTASIMVIVETKSSILIGGKLDPAYSLIVTALPPDITPTKNKRSTHLIQEFMREALSIGFSRGLIRFETVLEGNLATNGMTTLHLIEQLERQEQSKNGTIKHITRHKSINKQCSDSSNLPVGSKFSTLGVKSKDDWDSIRGFDEANSQFSDQKMSKSKSLKTRKSIMSLFRR